MVPPGNKAKRLSLVNHATKIIHQLFSMVPWFQACNPVRNVLRKTKKSSKARQNQKTLISIFVYILTSSPKKRL